MVQTNQIVMFMCVNLKLSELQSKAKIISVVTVLSVSLSGGFRSQIIFRPAAEKKRVMTSGTN